ncbi:hypothetical protein J2X37_001463 [Croceicoccus sp. BE223]|nr:hypothetical protein [Croceicoccus sp. BE223]
MISAYSDADPPRSSVQKRQAICQSPLVRASGPHWPHVTGNSPILQPVAATKRRHGYDGTLHQPDNRQIVAQMLRQSG